MGTTRDVSRAREAAGIPPAGIDPNRVTVNDARHLRYWSHYFGCLPARLQTAVRVAGTVPTAVQHYLRGGR